VMPGFWRIVSSARFDVPPLPRGRPRRPLRGDDAARRGRSTPSRASLAFCRVRYSSWSGFSSFSRASISLFFSCRKFMRKKISVIGEGVQLAPDLSRAADVGDDVRGADVVVLARDGDLAEVARSAPAATLLVTGASVEDRCAAAYKELLFPPGRIIGIPDPERVGAAVESILFELDEPHEVIAMQGDGFAPCTARLGRGGIRELL
jgi:hypothetical protein